MPNHRLFLLLATLLLIGFPFRMMWYERTHRPQLDEYLSKSFEGKVVVVDEPEEKSYYVQVIVRTGNQKIILHAPFYPSFSYGDELSIKGKLSHPKDFKTDSGRTFPYQKFLAKDDIFYVMNSPNITLIAHHKGNPLISFLFSIKNSFTRQIQSILPRPESSLLAGMLIAGKQGLGTALEDKFKNVGLIHIVVLSGSNVTIIAEAFIYLLSFFPRIISYSFGATGIILFSIMAGGSSTIIRAAFMSIIALVAKLTGNKYSALRILFIGAVGMILWNPLILMYDPSFHLSFLATFALIVFSPLIQKRLGRFGESFFGEIISSTLAVELFLYPYLIYMNGKVSLVSLPANLLVLMYVPFTMLSGFVATTVSYMSLPLSYIFSVVSFTMLHYILRIVDISNGFSFIAIHL